MPDTVIIDVRDKDEFANEHVENSINIPLPMFASIAHGVLYQLAGKKIIIMCNSGARASQAKDIAVGFGLSDAANYEIYDGGIPQWKKSGNPVISKTIKGPLPLIRQVQLTVGASVVIFCLLGLLVNPAFIYLAAAFGAGLIMAGLTGLCPLANLIAKMPWNTKNKACC